MSSGVFCIKQKTAYELRISDWSSDVCSSDLHALFLEDVFVPEENRLGEEGKGFKVVMEALNASRPLIGARGVGLAQGALDKSVAFVKNRHAFGSRVADYQGVRWMLADMAIQTEAARGLVYRSEGHTSELQSLMRRSYAVFCLKKKKAN